jgi:hypothetical protein
MEPSKLQIPDPRMTHALWRIAIQARALFVAHVAAFLGTGFAALAMAPAPLLPHRIFVGKVSVTMFKVLWVGWPYLASLGLSRSRLPGKTLAVVLFLVLLVAVTAIGFFFLDTPLANGEWGWDVFRVAAVEAVLLTSAAQILANEIPGSR